MPLTLVLRDTERIELMICSGLEINIFSIDKWMEVLGELVEWICEIRALLTE